MSKGGPRFTKEEKLAIVKEGEKTDQRRGFRITGGSSRRGGQVALHKTVDLAYRRIRYSDP
jgi:hypothetical protein